jgi:hypothetical protein
MAASETRLEGRVMDSEAMTLDRARHLPRDSGFSLHEHVRDADRRDRASKRSKRMRDD